MKSASEWRDSAAQGGQDLASEALEQFAAGSPRAEVIEVASDVPAPLRHPPADPRLHFEARDERRERDQRDRGEPWPIEAQPRSLPP